MSAVCLAGSSRRSALVWTTFSFFAGFAGVAAFGPVIPKIQDSLGPSPVLLGLLGASPAFTGALLRIPFGTLVDRSGGKRLILILLGLSAAGLAGLAVVFGRFPSPPSGLYPLFLLLGVLCGCGIAVFSVGIPTVSYWYPQAKQGLALALYGGLGNLAPGIFSIILPLLVQWRGFTASYLTWLAFLLLTLLFFGIFMKDAPYFQYREMGIEIDREALLLACGQELIPTGQAMAALRRAASDPRTWILTFFYFVSFGGFIALTVWFPTFWSQYFGFSLIRAGFLTALYSLSASLLRVLGGLAADRVGGLRVLAAALGVTALGAAVVVPAGGSAALAMTGGMIMALGMGFANAAVFKLVPRYVPDAVGGTAGIVGGLGALGGFIIPVLLGLAVKLVGPPGYPLGFVVFIVLAVVSLGLSRKLAGGETARTGPVTARGGEGYQREGEEI